LYRWHATYCQKLGRSDDALAAIRQMVEFSDGSREDLLDIVDWLLVQKLWSVVDEVARKHEAKFAADAELLYRWAESQRAAGDARLAEETAQRAHGLAAGDTQRSFVLAERLQERGMLDWCERELRAIIGRGEMVSREGVVARSMLAELLHDQEKEDGAADALADLIKAAEANSVTAEIAGSLTGRSIEELQSRMYYFAALAHLQKGKRDDAKTALEKGLAANDEDADLLIGMHRFPGADEEWRKRTSRHIAEAARNFKEIIDRAQSNLEQAELEAPQEQYKLYAAIFCNQYAWLVGNTEGDIQEAIRLSQLSLELRPGTGGYMDTLAHCYFRAGDLENAVRWQRKAIALDPVRKGPGRAKVEPPLKPAAGLFLPGLSCRVGRPNIMVTWKPPVLLPPA
jgi:tetratricopeptide (TPR) repeat protein